MNAEPGWRSAWVARLNWLAGIVAAAEHGAHPAVRGHRDQRDLLDPGGPGGFGERRLHGVLGRSLQVLIQGGADHETRLLGIGVQPAFGEHPVGEVARPGAGARRGEPGGRGLGRRGVGGGDHPDLRHAGEDHGGAGLGELEIAGRRVARRRPDQAREHRRLGERQRARRLGEIAPGRGVGAVGATAQIDAIEIQLEDLRLVEAGLDPERVERLLDLAGEAALGREEHQLRELLADRAAALDHAAGLEIADEGAADADRIDARMLVEAPVLDRDHRLGQPGRDLARATETRRSGRRSSRS